MKNIVVNNNCSFILSCDSEKDCKSVRISKLVRSEAVARGQVDLTTTSTVFCPCVFCFFINVYKIHSHWWMQFGDMEN